MSDTEVSKEIMRFFKRISDETLTPFHINYILEKLTKAELLSDTDFTSSKPFKFSNLDGDIWEINNYTFKVKVKEGKTNGGLQLPDGDEQQCG